MLSTEQIDQIGWDVAREVFPAGMIRHVSSRPGELWDGEGVVRVLFVLKDDRIDDITGERATRALGDLNERLMAVGEARRGSIGYATEEELAQEQAEYGGP